MKAMTYFQCITTVVQEHGYKDFEHFDDRLSWGQSKETELVPVIFKEVAKLYAKQALIVAAEQAKIGYTYNMETASHDIPYVRIDSIINADLTEIEK